MATTNSSVTSSTTTNSSVTSSHNPKTTLTTILGPSVNSTAATSDGGGGMSDVTETTIAVVVVLIILVIFAIISLFILKKYGKLPPFCYRSRRKRRSSTSSSRRALDDEESVGDNSSLHRPNEKLKRTTEEMFTIDDFQEADDDPGNDRDREEYFYDEVFGQSEFEDETTKNSVRQLYTSQDDSDQMLDFDFETLGIRADGLSREAAAGKVTI